MSITVHELLIPTELYFSIETWRNGRVSCPLLKAADKITSNALSTYGYS